MDSLSRLGWELWCQDSAGSDPAYWRLSLPPSLPLIKANLTIQRKASAAGFFISSAVENRKKGSLELEFIASSGPGLRLSVMKRPPPASAKQNIKLALAAYEVQNNGNSQLALLLKSKTVLNVIVGRRLEVGPGKEVVNYLPLEPKGYPQEDPGPNTILVDDRPAAVRSKLSYHSSVNSAAPGLCVRYGSRAVEVRAVMDVVAEFCAKRNLWLLEPLPTAVSVASSSCKRYEAQYLSPDVYITSRATAAQISQKLRSGIALARKKGRALILLPASEPALKAAESLLGQAENRDIKPSTISEILP